MYNNSIVSKLRALVVLIALLGLSRLSLVYIEDLQSKMLDKPIYYIEGIVDKKETSKNLLTSENYVRFNYGDGLRDVSNNISPKDYILVEEGDTIYVIYNSSKTEIKKTLLNKKELDNLIEIREKEGRKTLPFKSE